MLKRIRKNEGITLLALVITIVVIVILGGVVISMVIGENGLINRTIKATEDTKLARAKEDAEILIANYIAERENNGTTLKQFLEDNNIPYEVDDEGNIILTIDDYEISVDPVSANMEEPEKETSIARVTTEPRAVETGGELKAVFKFGNDVDIENSKYLFRKKSDVEVKESDIDTPIVTQTASINDFMPSKLYEVADVGNSTQTLKLDLDTEEKIGTYEVFLLVVYNDHNKAHKIKRTEVVIGTPVESIEFEEDNVNIGKSGVTTLSVTVKPDNATKKDVIWESLDTSIAIVNSSGQVTGKQAGTTKIRATATDGSGVKAECTIVITHISVSGISLNKSSISVNKDSTYSSFEVTVSPDNASNKEYTWSCSPTSVATISNSGVVTAKAAGTATVTVTSVDDNTKKATCTVTVPVTYVTGITISAPKTGLKIGEKMTMNTPSISPSNADNKAYTWKSSNTSVATISSSGVVTAIATGTTTITAKASDSNKKESSGITITVTEPASLTNVSATAIGNVNKSYPPSKAFDGKTNTYWYLVGTSMSLSADVGSGKTVTSVTILRRFRIFWYSLKHMGYLWFK